MFIRAVFLALCIAFPTLGLAQNTELKLPSFDHLRAKAAEFVDIDLGAWPLKFAALLMDEDDPEQAGVKELLQGVGRLHVLSYKFRDDDEYRQADIESVRQQLQRDGWSRLVQVRSREERSAVDVSVVLDEEGKLAKGLAVVVTEPREFTIVHLVGSIDPTLVAKLGGHFGLPHFTRVGQGN